MGARVLLVLAFGLGVHGSAAAQTLTGTLVGIIKDSQGRVVEGATARVTSH